MYWNLQLVQNRTARFEDTEMIVLNCAKLIIRLSVCLYLSLSLSLSLARSLTLSLPPTISLFIGVSCSGCMDIFLVH